MLPSRVSAWPSQGGKEVSGTDNRDSTLWAAASWLCVLANLLSFLCPSSLLVKQGEVLIRLCFLRLL